MSAAPAVIFATPHAPETPGGAGLVVRGRLQALVRAGARVHLVREGPLPADARALDGLCTSAESAPRKGAPLRRLARTAARLATEGYVPKWNPRAFDALRGAIERLRPDAVVLDDLRLAEHGRALREAGYRGRLVLHEHNVEHVLLDRQRRFTKSAGKRLELGLRVRRFRAMEAGLARFADACVALTDDDRQALARLNPAFDVRWIPPDVDLDRYRASGQAGERDELLFIGSLNWAANADGLEWFLREAWPRVRERRASAHLTVVGRNPPAWLADVPGVTATGFVDDERPHYERARAVIVPLRFGSGVRIKILTALAMRRAVVSTRLGAEGIPLADGDSVLLADDAESFARATLRLLDDAPLADRIATAGHAVCLEHYAPDVVAKRFVDAVLPAGFGTR